MFPLCYVRPLKIRKTQNIGDFFIICGHQSPLSKEIHKVKPIATRFSGVVSLVICLKYYLGSVHVVLKLVPVLSLTAIIHAYELY